MVEEEEIVSLCRRSPVVEMPEIASNRSSKKWLNELDETSASAFF